MATVILVRHGRSSANAGGILAGRLGGVRLDATGQAQAERAGERIAGVPVVAVVSSPLERCRQTARAVLAAQQASAPTGRSTKARRSLESLAITTERGITECDYGEWQGRPLKDLAKEALWKVVQNQPSAAAFPGGESLSMMQIRAVSAIRRHDAALEAEHGPGAVWVAVSHGDIIKSVLADALGMHLDLFQRINVDPASLSIIRYTDTRPYVLASNTHAGDLGWLAPPKRARRTKAGDDAPVGGGAGPSGTT